MFRSIAIAAGILLATAAPAVADWERVAPGYVAYTIDQASAGGPIVFAGHEVPAACEDPDADFLDDELFESCLQAAVESQRCQAVGCNLYRMDASGEVRRLAREHAAPTGGSSGGQAFGFYDVRLSRDGQRIAAVGVSGGTSRDSSHLWTMSSDGSGQSITTVTGFASASAPLAGGFITGAGQGRMFRSTAGSGFRAVRGPSSCAIYRVSTDGPQVVVTGYAGTFRLSGDRRKARRIGPGGEALWVSADGRTIALAESVSGGRDARMLLSRNGGSSWSRVPISDASGEDDVSARYIVGQIAGTSAGDLWAAGGRRDEPGSRVWRFTGQAWERVPAPNADRDYFSDMVVTEAGRPVVTSLRGIYQLAG